MINKATYGNVDVTERVRSLVKDGKLLVKASNDVFGDLAPGVFKYLVVDSDYGQFTIQENAYLQIPASTNRKLGIFYTNNNVDRVVKESLMTLTKFSHVADILTCSWRHIEGNPFFEARAISQSSSHLNIVIQILQLLYTARESGKYDYVSFLEHDVLYPDGYFDYPEFTDGVMTNMNYKGICDKGWQSRNADHEPLHQMTMRFEDAIKHFEASILEAIERGGILVEPQTMKRLQWHCPNPAVHINHGRHFTSHFSIYDTASFESHNDYWGPAQPWIDKLF
jgi:hypothetical protein